MTQSLESIRNAPQEHSIISDSAGWYCEEDFGVVIEHICMHDSIWFPLHVFKSRINARSERGVSKVQKLFRCGFVDVETFTHGSGGNLSVVDEFAAAGTQLQAMMRKAGHKATAEDRCRITGLPALDVVHVQCLLRTSNSSLL